VYEGRWSTEECTTIIFGVIACSRAHDDGFFEEVPMALPPDAYEEAWKRDKSICAMAEAVFQERRGEVEHAEAAWELDRLIESKLDPDKALSVILGIMALDKDEEIDTLGSGPLEDFLNHSGPEYIDVIEKLAAKNPRFKTVLGGFWQTATMDLEVWNRVERIRGGVK
jgi:hypothetical protein